MAKRKSDSSYFQAKSKLHRTIFPIFIAFILLCTLAGFADYGYRLVNGEQLQFSIRYGWIPTASLIAIIGLLIATAVCFGLKNLKHK